MNPPPSQSNPEEKAESRKLKTETGDAFQLSAFPPVYDCWNTIGVGGNGSCRELVRFVHCRNCPVYSAAALQLLDRPVTDEYRREWSAHYAREKKLTTPAKTSVVIFRIGSEWLALPTEAFQEIAERRAVHSLPHRRREVVLGLVNVRGELLICASLGRLLGLKEKPETLKAESRNQFSASATGCGTTAPKRSEGGLFRLEKAHRTMGLQDPRLVACSQASRGLFLLVANWHGNRIAFPVDEVPGIQRVHQDELREPPATVAKSTQTYSRGVFAWRDRTIGLLDAGELFAAVNRNLT